ncbi:hypothetical protein M422DRAFT_149489 [Sphaerobolus stellatus SS14]|uniref:DDE Tnp4 domain-containing protein n=1 Tax=Sphaerobolus stellatus (strain SS14) TaxID=990650 RepID=A0A0C9UQJ5_SPHS4|nr:hypothetical protein M422DRAFT_186111 [Sphaerobolus stellatus SS14]KIJ57356.1 hypothetical protein M422DRAFT_149489 [Sphaerobolus stellatus SS14]
MDDRSKSRPEIGGTKISWQYLGKLTEEECEWAFRFTQHEIRDLLDALKIPNPFITRSGSRFTDVEALCLLLARLRMAEDQFSLSTKYDRCQAGISEITNELSVWIEKKWGHLLDWDEHGLMHPDRLREYADAFNEYGVPCRSLVALIDCTIRPTCRPVRFQELAYTGYKKCHGLKFQALVIPNGLIAVLHGPFRAPQNDMGVYAESMLAQTMLEKAIQPRSLPTDPPERRYFQIYRDAAYGVSPTMLSPFLSPGELTAAQKAWNLAMGKVRISVEHGFGLVAQQFPFINCVWKQKIWGTRCGTFYKVATLLTNAKACLRPNQTAIRYGCMPPELKEYFYERM